MNRQDLTSSEDYAATYQPEDDKLRLYVGRVPRDEYEFLRAEGWTSTPKQDCDFVAVWTPSREATAIQYAGFIGDEDTPPTERAADRAERFAGYQEKRLDEATGHADRYESGPSAHGFQSEKKAERAAARHDRIGTKAADQWSKAEYWQRRTAGVISHALHKSSPSVRMGRIKVLEAELRKRESEQADWIKTWDRTSKLVEDPSQLVSLLMTRHGKTQAEAERDVAEEIHGSCAKLRHPRNGDTERKYIFELVKDADPVTLADFCDMWKAKYPLRPATETYWTRHLKLRLAYEHQMLEAQGGRAAMVEMEAGGFIGKHQVTKVTKSPATGRVVSVEIEYMSETNQYGRPWSDGKGARMTKALINIEREGADIYRAPTDEERTAYAAKVAASKKTKAAAAKERAAKGENCPLINPTDEDAERLQALINERHVAEWIRHHGKPTEHYKPKTASVERITQAVYSANSSGNYAKAETRGLCANGEIEDRFSNMYSSAAESRKKARGPALCKIRMAGYDPVRVLIISDKPQKPLPAAVWQPREVETIQPQTEQLQAA